MDNLSKTISEYIEQQFPAVYREDGDNLVAFIEAYFEFLENDTYSSTTLARSMFDHGDIDRTLDAFLYHFNLKYLSEFPYVKTVDNRFAIKHIMDFYRSKGSPRSAELLIRFLFNSEASVYFPADDIFRLSDSKWFIPRYLEVTRSSRTQSFVDSQITGSVSGATAFAEGVITKRINGRMIDIIFISNLKGNFLTGEFVTNDSILDDAPQIIGSLSSLTITTGGNGNQIGDVFNVISNDGLQGKVRLTELVSETGKITFSITDGGSGYTLDANTIVYVADAMIGGNNTNEDFNLYEPVQQKRVTLNLQTANSLNEEYVANSVVGDTLEGVDSSNTYVATGVIYSFANTDIGGNTVTTASEYSKIEIVVTDGSFMPRYSVDFASANVEFISDETVTEESAITIELGNISGTFSNNDSVAVYVYSDPSEVGSDTVVTNYSKGTVLEANATHLTLVDAWGDFSEGETIGVYAANGTATASANIVSSTVTSGGAVGTIISKTDSNTWVIELSSGTLDVGNKVRGNTSKVEDTISTITETGVTTVWLNGNNSFTGVKSSVSNTGVSGTLMGQNTSVIGIYANTGEFYYTEGAGFTIETVRDANNISMVMTALYTGENADITVASLSDIEYINLNTDNISDTNIVGQLFTNINADASNSGVGYLASVSVVGGGSGYSNGQYTLAGGGSANGNPVIDAVVTIGTNGGGTITSVTVDNPGEGYYQEPTLTLSPGSSASLTLNMVYGYGYPKNPYGDANTALEDLFTFANTQIGSVDSITTNPGTNYNIAPFTSIYNELIAGYNYQDTRLDITISSGSFAVGENLLLDGNIMGEIRTANSTVIFLKRTIFEPDWSANTTILGETTGATATINLRAADTTSSPMGDNAIIDKSVATETGSAGAVAIVDSGYGYLDGSTVTLTKTGSEDIIATAFTGQQGIGSGYWTTTRSHLSDTSRLHDNKYYQEYSYEIQSDISLNKYRDIAGKVLHVAGTKLFGAVIKNTKIDMNQTSIGSTVEAQDDFADAFIMTVTTNAASQTFAIPTQDVGTFDAIIDWGDGKAPSTITSYDDAGLTHVYDVPGEHQIRITGTFPYVRFRDSGYEGMVTSVENLGDVGWISFENSFYNCSNMTSFTGGTTDTSFVTTMYAMFYNCSGLTTLDVSSFDTSSVTDMRSMFYNCSGVTTLDVSSFNTSSVTTMYSMFNRCSGVTTLDVSGFNTSSVTTMYAMFNQCSGLTDIIGVDAFDISGLNTVTSLTFFATNVTLPTSRYDALLIAWEAQDPFDSMAPNFGGSKYTGGGAAATARSTLTTRDNWTITDGGIA